MHLQIVIAFALLLWWPDGSPEPPWLTDPLLVFAFVWSKPLLVAVIAAGLGLWTQQRLRRHAAAMQSTLGVYHRVLLLLRLALLGSLAADLLLTNWASLLDRMPVIGALPGLTQLVLLIPYFLGIIALWWILYPVEQASREPGGGKPHHWSRRRFVVFNLRHQVLIVALPLTVIVIAYAITRDYRDWFIAAIGSKWGPELVLSLVAVAIFVFSPIMLRRIWSTSPLPDGPLRRKLLAVCDRIGLRVREILIWHSDGLMVNAAVMGLFPRIRYILLSDTLLESMTDEEIEAVFGHEAGHVRHHHIPYFLLFAFASMLIASGVIELLIRLSRGPDPTLNLSNDVIQAIGLASVVPVWGIAFGWVSRRFERQADLFGARCASPGDGEIDCKLPCAIHDQQAKPPRHAVCATGARIFVGALHKVALLNGIPPTERSWRHSSIASRMRFLTALSGDPIMARRFMRGIRGIKLTLILCCTAGLAFSAYYIWRHPGYHREVVTSVIEPLRRLLD